MGAKRVKACLHVIALREGRRQFKIAAEKLIMNSYVESRFLLYILGIHSIRVPSKPVRHTQLPIPSKHK